MMQGRCYALSWPKSTFSNFWLILLNRKFLNFLILLCAASTSTETKTMKQNLQREKTEDSNDLIPCLMDFFRFLIHLHRSSCNFNDLSHRLSEMFTRHNCHVNLDSFFLMKFDFLISIKEFFWRVLINHRWNVFFLHCLIYDFILQELYDHLD